MENENEIRRILKYFRCQKCGEIFKRLVEVYEDCSQCENKQCDWMGEEISDKDYKKLKELKNRLNNQNNQSNNMSSNIGNGRNDRNNSNSNNYQNNRNSFNSNINNNRNNLRNNIFSPFDDFFNDRRMGGIQSGFNDINMNMNMNSNNNLQNQFHNNNNFMGMDSLFNSSFFGGFIRNPVQGRVRRVIISQNNFDPSVFTFGSTFNDVFQDNFSSNYSSSYNDNSFMTDYINSILQHMRESAEREGERPTGEKAFKKLNRFKLDKTKCKTKDNGELELPNCIICISNIELNSDTLLLPCGHMFHEECIKTWLQKHNTCPVCRFELPTD